MIDPFAEFLHVEPERDSDGTLVLGGGGDTDVEDVSDDDGEIDDEQSAGEGGILAPQIQPAQKRCSEQTRAPCVFQQCMRHTA